MFPKVDSTIIVTFLNKDQSFVSLCEEVDKVMIDCEEITFNGGDNGGLININDLVGKINDIENQVNTILTTLKTVTITLAPSGAFPLISYFSSINNLSNTSSSDIEDEKITH